LFEHIFVGVGVVGGASCTVKQHLVQVPPDEKYEKLVEFIDDFLDKRDKGERLLVFTNSKLQAKGLDEKLYDTNFDTGSLHGDLQQHEREENLRKFRKGDIDIMIATDVASRGLDISGVSQVLNYDLPNSIDVYVQRIGRTGRIGHRGLATTFIAVSKDGQWHDWNNGQQETLMALPETMSSSASGSEVPDWLERKVEELKNGNWGTSWKQPAAGGSSAGDAKGGGESWPDWKQVENGSKWDSQAKDAWSNDQGQAKDAWSNDQGQAKDSWAASEQASAKDSWAEERKPQEESWTNGNNASWGDSKGSSWN